MNRNALFTASLLAALAHLAAQAADPVPGLAPAPSATPYATPAVPARSGPAQTLAPARAHIAASRWVAAIDELRKVNASGDADWNNLMGYAMRKQSRPDLDGAQKHYDMALRINPQHQGALEYAGELALMKRDLATAEKHLATLSRLCSTPCEPLDDLKAAVASYKATNK